MTLDVGRWTLDVGRWTLNIGRWTLDVGRWTLDPPKWNEHPNWDDHRSSQKPPFTFPLGLWITYVYLHICTDVWHSPKDAERNFMKIRGSIASRFFFWDPLVTKTLTPKIRPLAMRSSIMDVQLAMRSSIMDAQLAMRSSIMEAWVSTGIMFIIYG